MQEISLIIMTGITRYTQIVCYDRKGIMNQVEKRKKKKAKKKKLLPPIKQESRKQVLATHTRCAK